MICVQCAIGIRLLDRRDRGLYRQSLRLLVSLIIERVKRPDCSMRMSVRVVMMMACMSVMSSREPLAGPHTDRDRSRDSEPNPMSQQLPDCRQSYERVVKKTPKRAMACPMFRDEEGFLAEWIAYHQMHGFDHIILFDHGSTDNYREEVQPWIDSGFATVITSSNWSYVLGDTPTPVPAGDGRRLSAFKKMMYLKVRLENYCKAEAVRMGYDFFVSLDLDEYLVPLSSDLTAVDELEKFFTSTQRNILPLKKFNYQSTPHLLEPVNLLTIEAYHNRMSRPNAMTYFKSVSDKVAFNLKGANFTDNTQKFIAECCNFHGCPHKPRNGFCGANAQELHKIFRRGGPWYEGVVINHYGRSLEKYGLKAKTWETATGEDAKGYNVENFLDRNVGRHLDRRALKYGCQLREILATYGFRPFLRPGDRWMRNVEFGRPMVDPHKGKRLGVPIEPGFSVKQNFKDHYFGYYTSLQEYKLSKS